MTTRNNLNQSAKEFTMEMRQLGRGGPIVSSIGLGCMGMSDFYGPADRDESLATIAEATERGVTLIDTGDFYGMGHNEMLIGEAVRGLQRAGLVISVKFGALRDPDMGWITFLTADATQKIELHAASQRP